ncbi:uncharacterized protein LOC122366211 [Amphibalanus amphitrite]|uniref:uncharacterized protein LOC122366211 n=1 Tax=Amphibalanus amphitrite TaxID=1232801 RepID=UPI001C929FDE|nr:uncharacterized protein LOC122366211 [Amphibalanus amphitrite]
MVRCHLLPCLWAALLWVSVQGRPSSVEQLPDGTDVMLSSMGLVEGTDQQHELQQAPGTAWQQKTGAPLMDVKDQLATEEHGEDSAVLRQLLGRLLPSVPSLQPPRRRRSGPDGDRSSQQQQLSSQQHQQLTRQLLRRFRELQKRSYPYRSDLLRQARGYMCLSKVCNFKGARGK